MRTYTTFLIVAIVLLTSCNPDDGPPPLTPDLVVEVKAFDLDNNGNITDIRVDFIVENNLNVTEYRVMVVPASSSNSFNQDVAVSIPRDNYLFIDPIPFETKYSESRLPTTLLDVNSSLIVNGEEYVVAILVVGPGNFQLSEFSRPFTLLDQGIYSGYYEGTGCCLLTNIIPLSVQWIGTASNYQGEMEFKHSPFSISNINFNIVDDIISNVIVSGGTLGELLQFYEPGSGVVINDLSMEISFVTSTSSSVTFEIEMRRIF